MDDDDKVVVSAQKVEQLLEQNRQYKFHLQNQEKTIQTFKQNEEKYETNIKQLSEQISEARETNLQISAKNQALNDLLQKKDASITTLQNQIVEYNRNDPGKILQTTLNVLYTVPQMDYTKLSLDELNTELQKIRFTHTQSTLDNVQQSEMDSFMKTKLQELEKLQKLNASQENLISELKLQVESYKTQITDLTTQNNERLINQNKETYESFNNRIKDLQFQLQQLSETNKQLKLERDQLSQQSTHAQNDLQLKIDELQTDNIAITELCKQQNQENSDLKQILKDMQIQLEEQENVLNNKVNKPDINQIAQTDFSINNQEIMYKIDFEQLIDQRSKQSDQLLTDVLDQFIAILQPIQADVLVNRQNINEHLGNFVKQFNDMLVDLQRLAHENEKMIKQQNFYKDEISKLEQQITKLQTEAQFTANTISSYKLQIETIQKQRQEQGDVLTEKSAESNALAVKISQLEIQLANQANNIQQLQQENASLQQENQQFITETNKLNQTLSGMSEMQQVISKYEVKISQIVNKHKDLQQKYEDTLKQSQQHEMNAAELATKVQELQRLSLEAEKVTNLQISELKQTIAQIEIENKHLRAQNEEIQRQKQETDKQALNQNAEYGRTQSVIQQNQVEMAKLNAELARLQAQLEATSKRLEEKELQIVQLNNDKEELNIHREEARQKLSDANKTLQDVDAENRSLKLKLEAEMAQNMQKGDKITELINQKNQELQKLQQDNFQLKVQFDGSQKEKQLIAEQLQELKKKAERLEDQKEKNIEQITTLGVQAKTLEREKAELQANIAQIRLQADNGEQTSQNLQKEISTLRNQLSEALQKHSAVSLQNQQLQDEILHQKTQYEVDFQELRQQLETTYGTMNERNLGQKEEVICTLNLELVNRKKEVEELRERLADQTEELQEQQKVARAQASKYEKLEEQFKALKDNTYEMKRVYEDKIRTLKEEKQSLQAQQSQLAGTAKTEVFEVQQRLRAEYAAHINDIVKKNRELQIANDQLQLTCNDHKMEVERLKYQAENVKNSMETLNSQLEKEKQDVGRYKELYRKAYSIVQNKKDEIKQYQAVIKDMDRQVSTITQQRYSQAYGDPGATLTPPSGAGLPRQSIQARAAQSGNYLPPAPTQDLGYQDLHE